MSLLPQTYILSLVPGKDFFYGTELLNRAVKLMKVPHPPNANDPKIFTETGILVDGKDHLVTWHQMGLDGVREIEDLFDEFLEEEGIRDKDFTRILIERIPELYEPGLLQPQSAIRGRTIRFVTLEAQQSLKEIWKRNRYYLINKI